MDIMKQVPICLPEKLLSGIDARAKTMQLSRSAYIRLCIVKYEMILAKKEASAQPMISDDNNIISDNDLRERERKEKEAKRIEREREQVLTRSLLLLLLNARAREMMIFLIWSTTSP